MTKRVQCVPFQRMIPFVPFVEAYSGHIEESIPEFQIPESQWTQIVAQEDMLESWIMKNLGKVNDFKRVFSQLKMVTL